MDRAHLLRHLRYPLIGCILIGRLHAEWLPPEKPDPQQILMEVDTDTSNKKYEDALAKCIWFHEKATSINPAMVGVRLSFALSSWERLGQVYPPALEKLKAIRDEAGKNIREGKAGATTFFDYSAINRTLGEHEKTKDLFIWLDANAPQRAKMVYQSAEPALIATKEYALCGRYLDADVSYQRMARNFRDDQKRAKDPRFGKRNLDFEEKNFSNKAATLVSILVKNGKQEEANQIAAQAAEEWDDAGFKELLEKAKKGEVPPPWP